MEGRTVNLPGDLRQREPGFRPFGDEQFCCFDPFTSQLHRLLSSALRLARLAVNIGQNIIEQLQSQLFDLKPARRRPLQTLAKLLLPNNCLQPEQTVTTAIRTLGIWCDNPWINVDRFGSDRRREFERRAIVTLEARMTDAISLVGIKEEHMIRISDDLLFAGMLDENPRARENDLGNFRLLFPA